MPDSIDIHIVFEHQKDDTGILDWVVLAILCVCSILMISLGIIMMKKSYTYLPLMTKNVNKLATWIFFALIMIWGSFIANEHIQNEALNEFRVMSCVAWTFWIQYGIGFNGCFAIILQRSLIYIFTFHNRYKRSKHKDTTINIITIVLLIPFIILALIATIKHASRYIQELNTCSTEIGYKLALIIMVILYCIILLVLSSVVNNGIKRRYWNEFKPMRDIAVAWFLVIFINGIIAVLGLVNSIYGRFVFTLLVCFLVLFVYLRLVGYSLWKAIRNDADYVYEFYSFHNLYDIRDGTLEQILKYPEIFSQFMQSSLDRAVNESLDIYINMIGCYRDILNWKEKPDQKKSPLDQMQDIITKYLISSMECMINQNNNFLEVPSPCNIGYPARDFNNLQKIRQNRDVNCLLDPVLSWILGELRTFNGTEFVIGRRQVRDELQAAKKQELENLQHWRLIDILRMKTGFMIDSTNKANYVRIDNNQPFVIKDGKCEV